MTKVKNIQMNLKVSAGIILKLSKLYLVLRLFGNMITPVNAIVVSVLLKKVMDTITYSSGKPFGFIIALITIYFVFRIINTCYSSISSYVEQMENMKLENYINHKIIEISSKSDIEVFDNAEYYNELMYIQNNYDSIMSLFWKTIDGISSFVSFVIIFVLMLKCSIVFTILMILACIPSGIARLKYTSSIYKLSLGQLKNERKSAYLVSLSLEREHAQEMRLYGLADHISAKYADCWKQLFAEKKKILKKYSFITSAALCLPEAAFFIVMVFIARQITMGNMTIGDYSLYIGLITQLWGNIMTIIYSLNTISENYLKVELIHKFMKRKPNIRNGNLPLEGEIDRIELKNISFKYPYTDKWIFKNLNLKISKGEKIAVVGFNGVGKSTLIKLLLRFYDVDCGEIYINEKNIKDYKIEDIRSQFGLYFQYGKNYAFTIRENIMISNLQSKGIKEFQKAMRISGMEEVLEQYKINEETYISKEFSMDGMELSGGQNQKLALGRTIFRDAPILILDEPSSALDPKAEHDFFVRVKEISQEKTVIYTSHRLANLSLAERIIVIENGMIAEDGTIQELLNEENTFAEFYKYYKEDVVKRG